MKTIEQRVEAIETWIGSFVVGTVTTPPQQPQPAPTPQPTPMPTTPPIVTGPSDYDWAPMLTTTLFPLPPAKGGGEGGLSISFTADSTAFPTGFKLKLIDESPVALPKEVVISEAPHSFTPVGGQEAGRKLSTTGTYLYFRYSPARYFDCVLTPGKTYYINVRHTGAERSTVSCQFGVAKY